MDLLKEVNHEATILGKLSGLGREAREPSHVNLCRLLGVMVDIPFLQYSLVLEYCAGGELYNLLHQRKVRGTSIPLVLIVATQVGLNNYNLVLNYCTQIAEGLEYMHTALDIPIIHRDLKTKNGNTILSVVDAYTWSCFSAAASRCRPVGPSHPRD